MYLPNVVEDYLSRAQVRLETATNLYNQGHYADAVRDSIKAIHLTTIASLLHAGSRISPETAHSDFLPQGAIQNVIGIETVLAKEAALAETVSAGHNISLSNFFTGEDAEQALSVADRTINLWGPMLREHAQRVELQQAHDVDRRAAPKPGGVRP